MRSPVLWRMVAAFALSALVASGAQSQGNGNSNGSAKAPQPPAQTPPAKPSPNDGVQRIAPADALAALEKGKAIIVDVRGQDSYRVGHVKGALWMPDISERIKELPRDKMIITYCS